jgi:hypothetical protein
MSLGYEYDMVLLSPRVPPTVDDVTPQQPRRRRRLGHRSHRARQVRHGRDHPDPAQAQGDAPRSAGIPCPAISTRFLVGDLSSLSLDRGKAPVAHSGAPSSRSAPPPPEESTLAEQSPAMAPSPYPFGLRNVAATYASAHTEPSGRHQPWADTEGIPRIPRNTQLF